MYIKELDLIVLEIPKNGSRTLFYAAKELYPIQHGGHKKLRDCIEEQKRTDGKAIAVIRDPKKRFVSQCNYAWKNKEDDLDHRLDGFLEGKEQGSVFKSQKYYLESGPYKVDLKLYTFEDLDKALNHIGWTDDIPQHNKGDYRWTEKEILAYPRINEVWEHYAEDFKLYEELKPKKKESKRGVQLSRTGEQRSKTRKRSGTNSK